MRETILCPLLRYIVTVAGQRIECRLAFASAVDKHFSITLENLTKQIHHSRLAVLQQVAFFLRRYWVDAIGCSRFWAKGEWGQCIKWKIAASVTHDELSKR
jgi:hypothetical protein